MTSSKSKKLKGRPARENAHIRILSGPNTVWQDWLFRNYAKVLRDTGAIPVHVEMYRVQIEETEVPEPDTRAQPKVIVPSDAERALLESKWGSI